MKDPSNQVPGESRNYAYFDIIIVAGHNGYDIDQEDSG